MSHWELCPDRAAREAPRQGGHRVAQGLSREILTPSKGAQRSERTVSLCWKQSADSPPPPKPSSLAGGNAHLGGEAAGVGDRRQAAREQAHMSLHKYQTSKSIFKSGPDLECLRTAIQVKPVKAVPWISRKSRLRSTLNTYEDRVHIYVLILSQLTAQAATWQVTSHVIKSHVMIDFFFFFGNIQTLQRPNI